MVKRKRTTKHNHSTNHHPFSSCPLPPPETNLYSSRRELSSEEKSTHSAEALEHLISVMTDTSKKLNSHHSTGHHRHNLNHALFLKRSRQHGHQYKHHYSVNHAKSSTSYGNVSPLQDEKHSLKLVDHCISGSERHADGEKAYSSREMIRLSSLVMDAGSPDTVKIVCGICQRLLKRKPANIGDRHSSRELPVVSVLVCGHLYHADCLEQRTRPEDTYDPPCLLCSSTCNIDT